MFQVIVKSLARHPIDSYSFRPVINQKQLVAVHTLYARLCIMPPKSKQMKPTGQQKIASFFSSPDAGNKRGLSCEDRDSVKRPKTSEPVGCDSHEPAVVTGMPQLSPEQKSTIEKNKQVAIAKLKSKLAPDNIGESWRCALQSEFEKPYFAELQKFVADERKKSTVYPPESEVYSWTQFFDIKDTKVVIIGQDPYHGPRQAHGLCFSVQVGVGIPPSLQNMYKELSTDVAGFTTPSHGYLVGWAQQGVLLLNACLTVVAGKPNSHQGKGWEKLTDAAIKWINVNVDGVVFILWGGYAQKKGSFIDKKRHLVLLGPHPSPLSVHRGFFGCKHFSKANEFLVTKGKQPIDWNHLPGISTGS